jgi:NTE family protein
MPNDPNYVASPESPVREIRATEELEPGIGLCLSGGGYRAMVFHVGVLWRLNEAGYLAKIERISSVSGGSITAGVLGMNWKQLDFDASGVARNFESMLVTPSAGCQSFNRHEVGSVRDIPAGVNLEQGCLCL